MVGVQYVVVRNCTDDSKLTQKLKEVVMLVNYRLEVNITFV